MNKIDERIEEATAEIQQNPNSVEAYERRGGLYTGKGEHSLAYDDYNEEIIDGRRWRLASAASARNPYLRDQRW